MKRASHEATAQAFIVRMLDYKNEFYRVGIEGAWMPDALARKMKGQGMKKGWPDFHFPLRRLWIELKIKPNKPTAEQLACHERIRECGDTVEVVTANGPEDAYAQFKAILARVGYVKLG